MTASLLLDHGTVTLPPFGAYRDVMNRPRRLAVVSATDMSTSVDVAATLMDQVQRGDRDAFALLYDELASLLYGIVLRVLKDPAMSEEVTQEVFVELWKNANTFDASRGNVRSWSATIAHRRAVDRVRSVEASRRRDQADSDERPQAEMSIDDQVVENLTSQRVRNALNVLSEKQRSAIQLAYFDGLSYREVATALDLPEGTIKTRIRDGMHRLRIELEGALS